ncbi:MAG: isoprenyl transferase [Bacillota bacterium]
MHSDVTSSNQSVAELRQQVLAAKLPEHIAIIMDGNGRWAKEQGLARREGHREGVKRLKEIVEVSNQLGVDYLTVFAFSTENWNRPQSEINFLMKLFNQVFEHEVKQLDQSDIKVRVLGRDDKLPNSVQKKAAEVVELTATNQGLNLNIALNYGGRAEIVDAAKEVAAKVKQGSLSLEEITEDTFNRKLYTAGIPDPDLLIRPSGEERISNFLLWQLAYAEFYFTEIYWPDFEERDLLAAIAEYQTRERRFGRVKEESSR